MGAGVAGPTKENMQSENLGNRQDGKRDMVGTRVKEVCQMS